MKPQRDDLARLADWRTPYDNRHKGPSERCVNGYCNACGLDWAGFLDHCVVVAEGRPSHQCEFEEREPTLIEPEPDKVWHHVQGSLWE